MDRKYFHVRLPPLARLLARQLVPRDLVAVASEVLPEALDE